MDSSVWVVSIRIIYGYNFRNSVLRDVINRAGRCREVTDMFKEYSDFMTAGEAMEALGIGKNLMYRLLNDGEIKAVRVGGKIWRISRKSLSDYAKRHTN